MASTGQSREGTEAPAGRALDGPPGLLTQFAGSDFHHAPLGGPRDSWTKFWLRGVVPLARIGTSPDHAPAAATRNMLEAVWAPANLLRQVGVQWTQTGPDSAERRRKMAKS